ncbi:prolyl oligopeptidase family serine peptidase [Aquiluna borgnonia]|uniref:Prolyl oligopeptidase family serine peptidase n=1 Tax=Aquiluna borgnonia TaxID=2499157 RepID=A0A7D4UCX5_9MICO|nr:prolyl oligopeptidase family serine peptidase [Aquiluna borgnonia]QKJ24694.1 prolyl oligopeptidase family serine peptidase [Aquiluna borgnonia]
MRKSKLIAGIAAGALVLVAGAGLFLGDYVYTSGTKVPCAINADDLENTPQQFFVAGYNSGPFPGDGWNKWVGHDLSDWWLENAKVEDVRIDVAEGVTLAAWYIPASQETNKTVIVTHGIGTSKRDFNTLLPTAMLVKGGFNVLLVDQRDTGESTCTDGRHSAGQEESSDFAQVAKWLNTEKGIPASSLGMFGVSGGAIATSLLPAKTDLVSAFAMEGTIFDFNAAATKEVEFQGYPGFLWQLALVSAQLFHGVNLAETAVTDSIEAAGVRPMLILHGDIDQRLDYQSSVDFYNYAKGVGANIELETFTGADHTEGMLSETDRYAQTLVSFFSEHLN